MALSRSSSTQPVSRFSFNKILRRWLRLWMTIRFSAGVRYILNFRFFIGPSSFTLSLYIEGMLHCKCAIYNQIEVDRQRYVSTFTFNFFSAAKILSCSLRRGTRVSLSQLEYVVWPIPITSPFAFELRKVLAVPFSKERNTGNLQKQYTRPKVYCGQSPEHLQVPLLYRV